MVSLENHPHFSWTPSGQSSFSGPLLDLYRRLDNHFLAWAASYRATEHLFPIFIQAAELNKLEYFKNFPHLVTFPVTLDAGEENMSRFTEGTPMDVEGRVHLTALAPVQDVLTPAACYHCYIRYQGTRLDAPLFLTTRCACFRRETHYLPLRRQWHFSMREIICVGGAEEVKAFLESGREKVAAFFESIRLPIKWEDATDPFFRPTRNPKALLQRLDPVKKEMIYGDGLDGLAGLAIGSTNFHRNYFGEAFRIERNGEDAFSGCIAFGLERWIYAILDHYGEDPGNWPTLEGA